MLVLTDTDTCLVEALYRCHRLGYTFGETPILFENRLKGDSKISRGEIYMAMYTVLRLGVGRLLFWRKVEQYGVQAGAIDSAVK